MDRNTIIGLFLISLVLIGYSIWMQPSEEELAKIRQKNDSIARVEKQKQITEKEQKTPSEAIQNTPAETVENLNDSLATTDNDSLQKIKLKETYGAFASSAQGEEKEYIIENNLVKLTLSSKGGKPLYAELKNYRTYDSLPLLLFDETSNFLINFYYQNRYISSDKLYFQASSEHVTVNDSASLILTLPTDVPGKNIEFIYTLKHDSYLIDFDVRFNNFDDLITQNRSEFQLEWNINALHKEKSIEMERQKTTVFYKYLDDDVDYISERKSETENLVATPQWISFKQHFFSTVLINRKGFSKEDAFVETQDLEEDPEKSQKYTKYLAAGVTVPIDGNTAQMEFYFGPNHYQTLKKIGMDLEDQIDLGWGIFGWVNKYLVIPIFNFLDNYIANYGIIILLLTIIIKLLLFPITYKNYISSAKMKALKPEIDELKAKYGDDPMKMQQATMQLYRQAGVNPLSGCVPMLLQLPILYAMFRFFPASIELRQKKFLWADDLSSYDSILDLPFNIPFYGDHVSLFTLLMAISAFLYTKTSSQGSMSGPQAQQMKIMMYFMPVMFLGIFNNYSAALSYYYFLANVISLLQQWIIKKFFINEEEIHRRIQEAKKRGGKVKKSKFQKRLEEMAKQRGYQPPKR